MHFLNSGRSWAVLGFMALILVVFANLAPIDDAAGDGILRFFGRFHILALHLPVSLLMLAPACSLLSRLDRFSAIKPAIPLIWWLGAFSAFLTVCLGLLLAANEGFSINEVRTHMLGGLTIAMLSFVCTGLANTQSSKLVDLSYAGSSVALLFALFYGAHAGGNLVHGEQYLTRFAPSPVQRLLNAETEQVDIANLGDATYQNEIRPILESYCFDCHGSDIQKAGFRLDVLDPDFGQGHDAPHWHAALDMINSGEMPPPKKKQMSGEERRKLVDWVTDGIKVAKASKKGESKAVIRRLTKTQYGHTLKDLLGVNVDFGSALPDDPLSEMGFSNNGELLQNSSLHLELFQDIARSALNKAIVGPEKPKSHHYRMYFGTGLGEGENNTQSRGYYDVNISTDDFYIDVMDEQGTASQSDTAQALKKYFSVSLRGSSTRQPRFQVNDKGIALYSAKPHIETTIEGLHGGWVGPSPNLAMQIKDQYPLEGDFIVRVKASKGESFKRKTNSVSSYINGATLAKVDEDGKPILDSELSGLGKVAEAFILEGLKRDEQNPDFVVPSGEGKDTMAHFVVKSNTTRATLFQIDMVHLEAKGDKDIPIDISLNNGNYRIETALKPSGNASNGDVHISTLGFAYFSTGWNELKLKSNSAFPGFSYVVFTAIEPDSDLAKNYPYKYQESINTSENNPVIIPYIGTRTDDGMDYKNFGEAKVVDTAPGESAIYAFKGRLENLPVPPHGNVGDHITSSSMKVGLWNDDKIKSHDQPGSVLNVEYIEFEAPYYEEWPPQSHTNIFPTSEFDKNSEEYAKLVISQFMEKAFRRAVDEEEIEHYLDLWNVLQEEFERPEDSIKEVLVAVLSSPNFLYLAQPEQLLANEKPASENKLASVLGIASSHAKANTINIHNEYALASRMSYFLWDSAPDKILLDLADKGELSKNIHAQMQRMLSKDEKLTRFVQVFAKEWLRLDRQQMQNVDVDSFPDYTRFVKADMKNETEYFLKELIQKDLSVLNLVDSNFTMLNQNLAEFYGIDNIKGHEFRPVTLAENSARGGLLGQGAFLTGHADGVHSHPVKRAVWVKEKILGDEPPPPPPNVPDLDPETPGFDKLTLKEQLELHRDKDSCRDCHAKIDPYGVVFEGFDAVGRARDSFKGLPIDAESILPDGTAINGMQDIKRYLMDKKQEDVVRSFIKHLYAYALGKDISFHDDDAIDAILKEAQKNHYSAQSIFLAILTSPAFKS